MRSSNCFGVPRGFDFYQAKDAEFHAQLYFLWGTNTRSIGWARKGVEPSLCSSTIRWFFSGPRPSNTNAQGMQCCTTMSIAETFGSFPTICEDKRAAKFVCKVQPSTSPGCLGTISICSGSCYRNYRGGQWTFRAKDPWCLWVQVGIAGERFTKVGAAAHGHARPEQIQGKALARKGWNLHMGTAPDGHARQKLPSAKKVPSALAPAHSRGHCGQPPV